MKNPPQNRSAVGCFVTVRLVGFAFHDRDWQSEKKSQLEELVKEFLSEELVESVTDLEDGFEIAFESVSPAALQLAVDLAHADPQLYFAIVASGTESAQHGEHVSEGAYVSASIYQELISQPSKFADFSVTEASGLYRLSEVEPSYPGRLIEFAERLQIRAERRGKKGLASPERIAERLRELAKDVAIGTLTVVIALFLHHTVSRSEVGEKLDLWAYEKLQGQILPVENAPVAVVNIGSGYDIPNSDGRTDLKKLAALLQRVLAQKPAAVAFDIDFSYMNDSGELLDQNEFILKPAYLAYEQGIPTYVSVDSGLARPPEEWLGRAEYEKLAVHPERPQGGATGQMLMLSSLKVGEVEVPSMSDKLAEALQPQYAHPPLPPSIATPYGEEISNQRVEGREYFLNPAALDAIKKRTVDVSDGHLPTESELKEIHGKAVIIGSASVNGDRWLVPGTADRWEAGLYLHAVGAYTRLMAPLYVFQPWVRFLLNLASAAVVLAALVVIRLDRLTSYEEVFESKLSFWLMIGVAIATIVLGVTLVRSVGVLWTDFFVVLLLLVNHPKIEHGVSHLWKSAASTYPKLKRRA